MANLLLTSLVVNYEPQPHRKLLVNHYNFTWPIKCSFCSKILKLAFLVQPKQRISNEFANVVLFNIVDRLNQNVSSLKITCDDSST